jgi:flagellar hook-associated protein 3 FlgL
MAITSVADQARSFFLSQNQAQVKTDLTRLTQELASGQASDLSDALRGDFTALSGIERSLRLFEAYRNSGAEAALTTSAAQAALGTIQDQLFEIGPALLAASSTGAGNQMEIVAAGAEDRLNTSIAMLNQQVAGRALFSGTATDTQPLISADALLAQLAPLAAGAVDTADLIATLDAWFMDAGGGFETLAYQGSTAPAAGFSVAEGEIVGNPLTALDPPLRKALLGMALASLVAQGQGPATEADKQQLLEAAALQILEGNEGVTDLRAGLGDVEARIESAMVRNDTARSFLELERNALTGIDPFTVATELQEAQIRLESLYLLTTRLSRLSLTEYM